MTASHGTVVTFNYTVKDDEGTVPDTSEVPLSCAQGYGEIISGLEKALDGAEPGYHGEVVIWAEEAYGERDESRRGRSPGLRAGVG